MLAQLKDIARDWLGPFYEPLVYLAYALFPFLGPHVLNGVFILSAIAIALWLYLRSQDEGGPKSAVSFFRYLVPRGVFLHKSALVDYKFYLVNSVFLSYISLSARVAGLVGLLQVADLVRVGLSELIGTSPAAAGPGLIGQVAYTLALVLAVDFAKFFAHFLQHKVPFLWEFHKVHHSAQVLTPLTNYRLHPVDVVLEQVLAAILAGAVIGAFGAFYSGGLVELTIMNMGAIYFIYFLAANLRHSHIPLAFGWRVSHVLSSPYMHQIHHSSEVRHWDRNYGLIFSFWDYFFRSLYVPRGKEEFRLGLSGNENHRFESVGALYAAPFVGVYRKLTARSKSRVSTS
jgi:sterol desaturase/sphingolipid hydroxylase (fatty acid hydroxylase superfamily)